MDEARRGYRVPFALFLILAGLAICLFYSLRGTERQTALSEIDQEANKVVEFTATATQARLFSLGHIVHRWEDSGGTPEDLWRKDAHIYVEQMKGLKALEWIGADDRVKWVEPEDGNQQVVGLDVTFEPARAAAVRDAAASKEPLITPPLQLVQGYTGFIAYLPVHEDGKLVGLMAGVFSVDRYFDTLLKREMQDSFSFDVSQDGKSYYQSGNAAEISKAIPAVVRSVQIGKIEWVVSIMPTQNFVAKHYTGQPYLILGGGFLIALLFSIAVHQVEVLRRKSAALSEREQFFRRSMEYAPIGKALVGLDGKFLSVNRALSQLVGYSEQELVNLTFQDITHPDDVDLDLAQIRRVISREIETYQLEKRYRHKDGSYIWILLNVALIVDMQNKPSYFAVQILDISDRKRQDEINERLLEKLTVSNTELERFAYVASHDMQEPLRMISNFGNILTEEYKDKLPKDGQVYLDLVTTAAVRMQAMIGSLLDYARTGEDNAQFTAVDVNHALQQALENLSATIKEHHVKIDHTVLPTVQGNPLQLMRLMQNIIGNGIKYQPPGGAPRIKIAAEEGDEEWTFSIADNGIGIQQKYLDKVFEPFKRLHSWQQYQGTGLGLSICKKIAEGQGGRIWAKSDPGNGSIFYFTIPKVRKEAA